MIYYCLALTDDLTNVLTLSSGLPYDLLLLESNTVSASDDVYTQFSACPNIISQLDGLRPLIEISVTDYYDAFFDIDTCNAQGLTQWGNLLNVKRNIQIPDYTNVFGFDTGQVPVDNQYPCNFGMGNFYGGQTINVPLSDADFRALLRLRYAYITTNATMENMNNIMNTYVQAIDPSYKAAVIVTGIREVQFQFSFSLTITQVTIFKLPGILPVGLGFRHTILGNVPL
jgi:hypothetical protein